MAPHHLVLSPRPVHPGCVGVIGTAAHGRAVSTINGANAALLSPAAPIRRHPDDYCSVKAYNGRERASRAAACLMFGLRCSDQFDLTRDDDCEFPISFIFYFYFWVLTNGRSPGPA